MTSNPFLTAWTKPKEAARSMKESKSWLLFFLIVISTGIGTGLVSIQGIGFGLSPAVLILGGIIGGPLLVLIGAFISTLFYWLIGKLFGGTGSYRDVLMAQSVSYIPTLLYLLLGIIGILAFQSQYFVDPLEYMDPYTFEVPAGSPAGVPLWFSLISGLIQLIAGIWSLVIAGFAIGVGHNISTGKAWGVLGVIIGVSIILAIIISFLLLFIFAV